MNNTNLLISSDNFGWSAQLLEREFNPNQLPGRGNFVGALCSAHTGDISPNIMGPRCEVSFFALFRNFHGITVDCLAYWIVL